MTYLQNTTSEQTDAAPLVWADRVTRYLLKKRVCRTMTNVQFIAYCRNYSPKR
jgi:hypothetical protein